MLTSETDSGRPFHGLWNFVNYNDKEAAATLNFNQLRKRVSTEDYFIDFKFECMSASAIRCRQQNFRYD